MVMKCEMCGAPFKEKQLKGINESSNNMITCKNTIV
jgi:hypothetical protein